MSRLAALLAGGVVALLALPPAATTALRTVAGVSHHESAPAQAARADRAGHAADGDSCGPTAAGEQCGPGNARTTPGGSGTGKVSHTGWPKITGVLWVVVSDGRGRHDYTGASLNDELLGHHGDDTVSGGAGRDVLWGDWDPKGNTTVQHDVLIGGAGADWLYTSHGSNVIRAGAGDDHVWAYYGRGTIDCGPGNDLLRVKLDAPFTTRHCEQIRNFCAFGSKPGGGCYKPGERPRAARSRS